MNNKQLKEIINIVVKPYGFKRKGNNWNLNTDELIKRINLQKSYHGNYYYINFGFIIKELKLNDLYTHVEDRLGSLNKEENKRIGALLDLDVSIKDEERTYNLKKIIQEKIIDYFKRINNKDDLLRELKNRSHLFDIPSIVKEYFKLQ